MIKWNLRKVMADRGVWTAQELVDRMEKKAGIIISHSAGAALMRKQPSAIRFTTLEAICVALDCEPWDVMEYVPQKLGRNKSIVGGEGGPIAPYRRKAKKPDNNTIYPEEDF